jgi:nucleotide-binding universal stress UspA family protein
MKVLIGIDDSPHSKAALEFARRMRWPLNTSFIVLSAAPVEVVAYTMIETGGPGVMQEVQQERVIEHEELAARVERELRSAGLTTVGMVERGDPRDVLVRVAEREHADLVIVGSHGRTGLSKLLMGSVASHVVAHAPCAVMVVKRTEARR